MTSLGFQQGTPLADALQNVIQPKLAENGWSSGAGDDSALSEYIILMLTNNKDQQSIATELATDLLGLEANDASVADFVRWLFDQVAALNAQMNGVAQEVPRQGPPQTQQETPQQHAAPIDVAPVVMDASGQDATMSGAMETAGAGGVPTGPRSMRNGARGRDRRMAGQMRNAIDRSGDAGIHKIRGAASRVNGHDRPPAGPRGSTAKIQNMVNGGGRGGRAMDMQMQNMIASVEAEHQMQLFKVLEEQSRMMAQLLGGPGQAAINPRFPNRRGGAKSLFERVDRGRHGGQRRHEAEDQQASGEDMELGESGSKKTASEVPCKFQLQCTSPTCPYAHQSPAAPPGITIDVSDTCNFGAACTNKKCVGSHPSPSQKRQYLASAVDCKFFPNCTNPSCPFRHPTTPPCRNGADCKDKETGCRFSHSTIQCRYSPCLNPNCPFKHEEGQRQSNTWKSGDHVSERKFDSSNGTGEELILPGRMDQDQDGAMQGQERQGQQPTTAEQQDLAESSMDQVLEDVVA